MHVNSLLVAKAEVSHRINIASVEADYDEDQLRLAEAKLMALGRQLRHLLRASHYIDKVTTDVDHFDDLVRRGASEGLNGAGLALSE
jgi:hypothetical protein